MTSSCGANSRRYDTIYRNACAHGGLRELPEIRRSSGLDVAARVVMSLRRLYWLFFWSVGVLCLREWTNGSR
jgi:hypothetical protein